ncbi:MAG TPA: DUF927 domain-containing protein [Terriglobia bacterium]|nr:DUF927 domain-containing protein [Terriglobia bacterium]
MDQHDAKQAGELSTAATSDVVDNSMTNVVAAQASADGSETQVLAISSATPTTEPPKYLSFGRFHMSKDGLFARGLEEGKPTTRLCDPFEVLGLTHSGKGNARGVAIAWKDSLGNPHELAISLSLVAGNMTAVRQVLLDRGLIVELSRNVSELLGTYLIKVKTDKVITNVDQVGWHGDAFVTEQRVYGSNPQRPIVFQPRAFPADRMAENGTLADWQQHVALPAIGNTRIALAISAAFAAPLCQVVKEDSGGFHFVGASSTGKTTALRAAASVWGIPMRTWHTTGNGGEAIAAQSNDGLLILDELSQVNGHDAGAMTYMLGNGTGKTRSSREAIAQAPMRWRLMLLSTGEIGLAEKLAEVGQKAMAGQLVRFVEIPADAGKGYGIFDTLNGFANGDSLARNFKAACEANSGHAIDAFLASLFKDLSANSDKVVAMRQAWLTSNSPAQADGQVSRVASRFAIAAAAGELAIELGILPWPTGEADTAAASCFQAWLERRGGTEAHEITTAIDQVRTFLERHGSNRFAQLTAKNRSAGSAPTHSMAGWFKGDEGAREFLFLSDVFRMDVCKGLDSTAVAKVLRDRGFLIAGNDGNMTRVVRIDGAPTRVFCVTEAILGTAV